MPSTPPPLLPRPKRFEPRAGALRLRDGMPIVLAPGSDDRDVAAARALATAARATAGVRLAIETHARTEDLGARIELRRDGERGDAHRIMVSPEAALAVGAGGAGLRYAAETLAQLVRADGRVPACGIEDEPDFRLRGLMLDVSRGKVPTLATLEAMVDLCVRLKLNLLMLYTEHTFRFRRHPEIGADASPLDAETMRALDAYAFERHVDLVPTLQSLGHMHHVLKLPRYADLAESESRWTISPADPGTYALLRDLYDEYLPNFRSRLFNANCDEPWDLGKGRSAGRAAELGAGGVWLEHVRRVRDLAAAHGKRTMVWADVIHAHPERIAELDRDLVLLDWWYEADHDFDRVRRFAEHGIEFAVCSGTASWNALFPRLATSQRNVSGWADAGRRHGALGLIQTDWGDFGHYNLQGLSLFGFAYAAQEAWSGTPNEREFDRALSRVVFGDATGEAARLHRALDAHDAGFTSFNASPLLRIFFDDVGPAKIVARASTAALRRSLRRLVAARRRLAGAARRFAREPLTHSELVLAADLQVLAARKGLLSLVWLAWRRRPGRFDRRQRTKLARELVAIAAEQDALSRRLRRLWLARSARSNFEIYLSLVRRSTRSLRAAARALERDRPPAPPEPGRGPAA